MDHGTWRVTLVPVTYAYYMTYYLASSPQKRRRLSHRIWYNSSTCQPYVALVLLELFRLFHVCGAGISNPPPAFPAYYKCQLVTCLRSTIVTVCD